MSERIAQAANTQAAEARRRAEQAARYEENHKNDGWWERHEGTSALAGFIGVSVLIFAVPTAVVLFVGLHVSVLTDFKERWYLALLLGLTDAALYYTTLRIVGRVSTGSWKDPHSRP